MWEFLPVLFRNLTRDRRYAVINIAGLTLGLASFMILGLFLRSELSFDQHFQGHENIYRVVNEFTASNGKGEKLAITSDALGPVLAEDYPDLIRNYVRFRSNTNEGGIAMRRADQPDRLYYWEHSYFTEPHVFDVFPIKVLRGDPKSALVQGRSVAISETVARRYFGNEDPIGRVLLTDTGDSAPNRVTLVFADLPPNTHLKFDFLFSNRIPSLQSMDNPLLRRNSLGVITRAFGTYTYLQVWSSFKPGDWDRVSQGVYAKYRGPKVQLQALAGIHLQHGFRYDRPNGNHTYLYGCFAVALIILVIACINYMNLATARAARRARSVGFRRILGASRASLALEFMAEALLFALISLVLAVVVAEVVLRFTPINTLMDGNAILNLRKEPELALWMLGAALSIGVLSGLYPACYLSSWAPITALTAKHASGKGNRRMREFLVVVQFTISAATIACTLLMIAQLHHLSSQPLGFEHDSRLMVSLRGARTIEKIPEIRQALLKDERIRGMTVALQTPDKGDRSDLNYVSVEKNDGTMEPQLLDVLQIGDGYEKVLGLGLKQGRDLSVREIGDMSMNLLVNEALVRKMGWTQPIGKRISSGRVVGVVRDFNFKSLKSGIEPLVIRRLNSNMSQVAGFQRPYEQRYLIIDHSGAETQSVLAHVKRVVKDADPHHPLEYRFLDEALDAQYKAELSLTKLIGIFAGISILIACMGLFGLAAFTTEQRSREIATRKVLGSSAWQIIGLLAGRVLLLVLIASVLAGVGAYLAVDQWLSGFAYRTEINPLIFALAAIVAGAVAFATVAVQSWHMASKDPIDVLRHV
jgi:putative ABC transport system permease protein